MPTGFPDYYGGLTLPVTVPEGGTGQTSLTKYGVLYGNGTSAVAATLAGAVGDILQIPSGGGAPVFQPLDISLATLSGILPVANGGTGSSSPALVAGAGIAISGTWPAETVACTLLGSANAWSAQQTFAVGPLIAYSGALLLVHNTDNATQAFIGDSYQTTQVGRYNESASKVGVIAAGEKRAMLGIDTNARVFTLSSDFGVSPVISSVLDDGSGNMTVKGSLSASSLALTTPLPAASGGTGAASLAAAGIPQVVASYDQTALPAGFTLNSFYTTSVAGMYRLTAFFHYNRSSGTSVQLAILVNYSAHATSGQQTAAALSGGNATVGISGEASFYCDSGDTITIDGTESGFGSGDSWDVDLRLEYLP